MSFRYRHGERPLDGYTIQRGVGRGGFGEVYYAMSDGGREVALKSILQNHEVELRGVRQCINLKSPHLVSIFDIKEGADGTPFVIMEYVAGPSLRDILNEYPEGVGIATAGYLVRELGRGLAFLHERGIVHRDLKPENVFYEDGYVKIGDYGLSKYISVSRQSGQTMSVGTIHYMAPEIGSGIYNRDIDIYALGIILYELLTGRVPFNGDSFGEILMKHLTAKPDLTGVEPPFKDAISRALEKKPEDRFPTVEEMINGLFADATLNSKVSLFNPASLSVTAERENERLRPAAATPVPQETQPMPAGTPPERGGDAPETPQAPQVQPPSPAEKPIAFAPYADPVRPVPPATPPASPPREAPRYREHRAHQEGRVAGSTPRRDAWDRFCANELRDPMDRSLRLGRAFFLAGVIAVVIGVVTHPVGAFGGLLMAIAGAAAVLTTELFLAERFAIAAGFPRNVVSVLLAAGPIVAGAAVISPREAGATAFAALAAMCFVGWRDRMAPNREERIDWTDTLLPAFWGLIAAAILEGSAAACALTLAAMSLVVNAVSPFVPGSQKVSAAGEDGNDDGNDDGIYAEYREGAARQGASPAPRAPEPAPAVRPAPVVAVAPKPAVAATALESPPPERPASLPNGHGGGSPVAAPIQSQPIPVSTFARVVWSLITALAVAGGVTLAVGWLFPGHPDDRAAMLSGGIALFGLSLFAYYRGHLATAPTFWRRSVRPFLMTALFTGAAVSGTLFWFGPLVGAWRFGHEETFVCLVLCVAAMVLLGFVVSVDWILGRMRAQAARYRHLARAEQPPNPVVRLLHLCLGAAGCLGGFTMLAVGLFAHVRYYDRIPLVCFGAVFAGLGAYFVRLTLRSRRGTFWSGILRPFLLVMGPTAAVASAGALVVSLAHGRVHDDEVMVVVFISTFALALTAFAFLVKGGVSTSAQGGQPPQVDATNRESSHTGWAALGTLFWIGGIGSALFCSTLSLGAMEVIFAQTQWLGGGELYMFSQAPIYWALPAMLVMAGCFCILISRWGAGALHILRAVIGQGALCVALIIVFVLVNSSGMHLSHSMQLEFETSFRDLFAVGLSAGAVLVLGFLGTTVLAWPARKKREAVGRKAETAERQEART